MTARLAAGMCLALVALCLGTPRAHAAEAWWGLSGSSRPTKLSEGKNARLLVAATDIGDGSLSGAVTLTDQLPQGFSASSVEFRTNLVNNSQKDLGPKGPYASLRLCTVLTHQVECTYRDQTELEAEGVPAATAQDFAAPESPFRSHFELSVTTKPPRSPVTALNQLIVSGGGAGQDSATFPVEVTEEAETPFGLSGWEFKPEAEGGGFDLEAGSHPFQLRTDLTFNQNADGTGPALPRDLSFPLPAGWLGRVAGMPECTGAEFSGVNPETSFPECPAGSAIGVVVITVKEVGAPGTETIVTPVYNLAPAYGEPARFGFRAAIIPVILDSAIRSGPGEDYGVTVTSSNTTQLATFDSAELVFWGTPGDPVHSPSRAGCLVTGGALCASTAEIAGNAPFLTLPASCPATPFAVSTLVDSWPSASGEVFSSSLTDQAESPDGEPLAVEGCDKVPFQPHVRSAPTARAATSATGLSFDLSAQNEGLLNQAGIAESQIKKAVVTLPEGFTANPSVAAGLGACSEAAYQATTLAEGTGCPEDSQIGEVEAESPLVEGKVDGSLFVARQGENPNHDLLTIYMVFKNPELGVLVKAAGKVEPNPVTGQLTTTFDDLPQLPISRFHLFFREGQRAPLITPPACGTYAVESTLYPWSAPSVPREEESAFLITAGPEGGGCPAGGVPPFHPTLEAGTINDSAGSYSPFYLRIARKDSEQEITHFSIKLPPGLLGKLAGVAYCPEAGIAQAKAREREGGGAEEEAAPSCPASSLLGTTLAGTGVGSTLAWVPGKVYLAGPYHGAPLSIVAITAAKVGPFDLGTVVVREALRVNPETAEVFIDATGSDPLPHIVDGIPVHLRDIRVSVDRPEFTLNPTNCEPTSTASTVLGSGADFASESDDDPVTVTSRFQAADCASLGFKPKLALSLTGKKTHRGALPAFKAVLTFPKGGNQANVAKAQVTLPKSEFLEQGHLKNVCTRKVFETGTNPGENCPPDSIYGKARAVTPLLDQPLEGPVYLRTGYGTRLPELAAALDGPQISITLAGKIDSVHKKGSEGSQIRNTFSVVPDAPVERFTLELRGGKKGLLVNSTDVCKGTHKALAAFTGQNGKLDEFEPALKAQCGKKSKKPTKGAGKKGGK